GRLGRDHLREDQAGGAGVRVLLRHGPAPARRLPLVAAMLAARPMASRPRVLLPGLAVGEGRYVVVKPLSLGRGGNRYLVRRVEDGTHWRMDVVDVPEVAAAFEEAVARMASWSHPGLVRVVDRFAEPGRR